jgi:CRP/FNR family transcriptional regulator, cyclic AMP receptor protein
LVFKDARTSIIELILSMTKEHGENRGNQILIKHNLTHQDLANLTATSRQTVTTLLNELKEQGVIEMERKKIFVLKIQALEAALAVPELN